MIYTSRNNDSIDTGNNKFDMSTTDIDKVDANIELWEGNQSTLTESSKHNIPKTNSLMKHYSKAVSNLEVIKERVSTTNRNKDLTIIHRKENFKTSSHFDQNSTITIDPGSKTCEKTRKSKKPNRKHISTIVDLINDSPNSIEVRKPPQPYQANSSFFESCKKQNLKMKSAFVIQKHWRVYKHKKNQKQIEHKRRGSKIPGISDKRKKRQNQSSAKTDHIKIQNMNSNKETIKVSLITTKNGKSSAIPPVAMQKSASSKEIIVNNSPSSSQEVIDKLQNLFAKLNNLETVPNVFKDIIKKDLDSEFEKCVKQLTDVYKQTTKVLN